MNNLGVLFSSIYREKMKWGEVLRVSLSEVQDTGLFGKPQLLIY